MNAFIFTVLVGFLVHAQDQVDDFKTGVQFYQSQKFADAASSFKKAAEADHNRPSIYYNWALSEYQLKNYSLSVGLLRRALYLDEGFSEARALLEFNAKELPALQNREPRGFLSGLKTDITSYLGLNKILLLSWLFFSFSTFLFLRYLAARKSAIQLLTPLPRPPIIAGLFALLLTLSLFVAAIKMVSLKEVRATVISSSLPLRTAPNPQGNIIVEALGGTEVTVDLVQGDWALVTLPNKTTGWTETAALIQNSGEKKMW